MLKSEKRVTRILDELNLEEVEFLAKYSVYEYLANLLYPLLADKDEVDLATWQRVVFNSLWITISLDSRVLIHCATILFLLDRIDYNQLKQIVMRTIYLDLVLKANIPVFNYPRQVVFRDRCDLEFALSINCSKVWRQHVLCDGSNVAVMEQIAEANADKVKIRSDRKLDLTQCADQDYLSRAEAIAYTGQFIKVVREFAYREVTDLCSCILVTSALLKQLLVPISNNPNALDKEYPALKDQADSIADLKLFLGSLGRDITKNALVRNAKSESEDLVGQPKLQEFTRILGLLARANLIKVGEPLTIDPNDDNPNLPKIIQGIQLDKESRLATVATATVATEATSTEVKDVEVAEASSTKEGAATPLVPVSSSSTEPLEPELGKGQVVPSSQPATDTSQVQEQVTEETSGDELSKNPEADQDVLDLAQEIRASFSDESRFLVKNRSVSTRDYKSPLELQSQSQQPVETVVPESNLDSANEVIIDGLVRQLNTHPTRVFRAEDEIELDSSYRQDDDGSIILATDLDIDLPVEVLVDSTDARVRPNLVSMRADFSEFSTDDLDELEQKDSYIDMINSLGIAEKKSHRFQHRSKRVVASLNNRAKVSPSIFDQLAANSASLNLDLDKLEILSRDEMPRK